MNMHGFITPATAHTERPRTSFLARSLDWMRAHRPFLLIVILPTLLVAAYYYLWAADQYESEAHFVIRSADDTGSSGNGFGQLLGLSGGMSSSQADAMGVSDYLVSHEVVDVLRRRLNLVERFRAPEADALAKLRPANPTPERLLDYYEGKVNVRFDRDTSISTLRVRAFRPEDSYAIIKALLELGERRVNELNERTFNDSVASARLQLAQSEQAVADVQSRITNFRQSGGDIDPAGSAEAQIGLVSNLSAELAAARAQLASMTKLIGRDSPQYTAMRTRVASLEREVASQSGRLAGRGTTIASNLGGYEDLKVRQDFVAKRYEAAAANLEKARDQASRQQLYLVRIVEPNRPTKAEYPERERILLTVFLGLLISYGIGWLLVAGVKEHAA